MKEENYTKLPRLYSDADLHPGQPLMLEAGQAHYLRNVLRRQDGDLFRVFNGRDGEVLAAIKTLGKKNGEATLQKQLREQPPVPPGLHLIFAPIKKQRLDVMIEKAVELGVTDLHPVITERTEMRKLNTARLQAQITEAAEQAERLTLPRLHEARPLNKIIPGWGTDIQLYACIERGEAKPLDEFDLRSKAAAFLIGPVGGFTDGEIAFLKQQSHIQPVSLGSAVLRCETAALTCLSFYMLKNG